MKSAQRESAIKMRIEDEMSYSAIAKKLNVAKSTLSHWLEDLPLSDTRMLELRREGWSRGEASREQFRKTMRAKREVNDRKVYLSQREALGNISHQSLFVAGLMLYASEGEKKSRYEIAFTNTDPAMVRFFARWLKKFLHIPSTKLRVQLHLYENMDISKEEMFWKKELSIKKTQLCKTQIKPLRPNSFSYRESFRHGTCKLYVGGGIAKTKLMLSIRAFFDTYEGRLRA